MAAHKSENKKDAKKRSCPWAAAFLYKVGCRAGKILYRIIAPLQ